MSLFGGNSNFPPGVTGAEPQITGEGRPALEEMTLEEKVDEILATLRALQDAVEAVSQNPMLSAFLK